MGGGGSLSFVSRETSSLYVWPTYERIVAELAAAGLPAEAMAYP